MPKRSSKKKPEAAEQPSADPSPGATESAAEPADQPQPPAKDPAAVSLGRRGGLKGGPARAAKLTKKERSEIAKKAAKARWN